MTPRRLCVVALVVAGCSENMGAPPPVSPWMSVLGDAHIADLGAQFATDRAVFALEGRFETPNGDRRVVVLDFDDQPVAAPWVFDDLGVDAGRFVPLLEPAEVAVMARRDGKMVEYRDPDPPTSVVSGNLRRFATAPVVGGHVIIAQNTLEQVRALYQPYGQPRTEVMLGMSTTEGAVAAASIGDGVLLLGEGADLRGYNVTASPFAVSASVPVATMPCPITSIVVTPRSSGALVIVMCESVLMVGTLSAAPSLSWQQHAIIDGRARAESVDVAALVTDDAADIVIQTDSLTVVPVLIHYRVDLNTGMVTPGVVLTDGVQRFGRQVLAHDTDGAVIMYALRTDPGGVRLVRASLQMLLAGGIPEPP
ncbi:MAG: hypothetical protein ACKV2T_05985 [Kofleriaceae bacterium]